MSMGKLKSTTITENDKTLLKAGEAKHTAVEKKAISEALVEEVILDKKGCPMTKEQVEEKLWWLVGNFRLDFRVLDEDEVYWDEDDTYDDFVDLASNIDDELLKDYEKDFFQLGKRGKIQFYKECYSFYTESLPILKRRLNKYAKKHVISEEDKKRMKKRFIEKSEQERNEHIEINFKWHHELESRIEDCQNKLLSLGVAVPDADMVDMKKTDSQKPKKMDGIDKVLYSYEPETETIK